MEKNVNFNESRISNNFPTNLSEIKQTFFSENKLRNKRIFSRFLFVKGERATVCFACPTFNAFFDDAQYVHENSVNIFKTAGAIK